MNAADKAILFLGIGGTYEYVTVLKKVLKEHPLNRNHMDFSVTFNQNGILVLVSARIGEGKYFNPMESFNIPRNTEDLDKILEYFNQALIYYWSL